MAIFFNVGDEISLYGTNYTVKGKITFTGNNSEWWDEYKILSSLGKEHWLSVDGDEIIMWQSSSNVSTNNMKLLDSGTKKAVACFGDVDVDRGEKATFKEYEKSNSYIEIETWDDGTEYSLGKICPSDSITIIKRSTTGQSSSLNLSGKKIIGGLVGLNIFFFILYVFCCSSNNHELKDKIESDNAFYKFETAITGVKNETADIFTGNASCDYIAKDIINKMEGDVEYVQENPLDTNTIAILTKKEMCIVYRSSVNNSTLVHLADRKWTFDNLDAPLYDADSITDDFYRSFYEFTAYASDSCQYNTSSSSHRPHFRAHGILFPVHYGNSNSRYNSYASTVRESSLSRRTSSGGGSSGGGK
ncbi:MAG: DUF4178 domain-containing protein [Bacteroidaceae bacterium]|nr:DUF4178 domain-containing protein [Bacteroidaceae bacterium]